MIRATWSMWVGVGLVLGSCVRAQDARVWSFEQAIVQVLADSPDARMAELRIEAARAGMQQANAALWPQVHLESDYMRTDNPLRVFGSVLNQSAFSPTLDFNDVPQADNLGVRAVVSVPLYAGGGILAGRDSAASHVSEARLSSDAVRNQLAFEVARAFFTINKSAGYVQVTEAAYAATQGNLGIVRHRFEAGTVLKTEVLQMEVSLAEARENRVAARNSYRLAIRALQTLLGLEGEEFQVDPGVPELAPPVGADFSRRSELAAALERTRMLEAEVRRARSGYKPQVNAFASGDYNRGWELNGSGENWTVGVMGRWNLWDGRRTRGRVREAEANLASAQEALRKTRLGIEFEVRQAQLNAESASERAAAGVAAVAQARENVELTRARFEQGLEIASRMVDAETALTSARIRAVNAESDQKMAWAALRRALGLPQTGGASGNL
ncbi:MAG: TolC family protein [Verrucomicrobia bacterium]|nr:TolC family protein [Verrucomicrobiota bacterium]